MAETALTINGMFCAGCAHHVRDALRSVPGVEHVDVSLSDGLAQVVYDPVQADVVRMMGAVAAAGYEAAPRDDSIDQVEATTLESILLEPRVEVPILAGFAGALGLLALYLVIISIAESPAHALQQLGQDALFVTAIVLGFGTQVGLFVHLRTNIQSAAASAAASSGAVSASSGGVSTAAMVACCAHHLVDVLPFLGLTAAAVFLDQYRDWLVAAALLMTAFGIGFMIYTIRKFTSNCALADTAPATANPAL